MRVYDDSEISRLALSPLWLNWKSRLQVVPYIIWKQIVPNGGYGDDFSKCNINSVASSKESFLQKGVIVLWEEFTMNQ